MKTKLPLSTIAYNEDILCKVLVKLYGQGVISFFCYIKHYGEGTGDSEKKDHYHVYIEPNKGIDPFDFKSYFKDADGFNTCLNWRKSDFSNWYYYCLHDPDYLSSKGLSREFAYDKRDMQCSDDLELDRLLTDHPLPNQTRLRNAILNGVSEKDMYMLGLLNPQNVYGVQGILSILNPENGKKGN